MKLYKHFVALLCAAALLTPSARAQTTAVQVTPPVEPRAVTPTVTPALREEAYRENNRGVALLEQYNHKDAAEAFRRALKIDPASRVAMVNLAIALYNIPDAEAAAVAAQAAAAAAPDLPQPAYIAGLIAKAQNQIDEAVAHFSRVLKIDPQDVGANVQLGQLYVQQRKYAEAVQHLRRAIDAEPYNTTAVYNLAQAQQRAGNREEGQALLVRFQELRQSGSGTSIGQNYLEQGRYAEGIVSTGAESDLVNKDVPRVTFADASTQMLPPIVTGGRREQSSTAVVRSRALTIDKGASPLTADNRLTPDAARAFAAMQAGGVTLFDYDADGDLDLLETASGALRLYRNDAGKYLDVTKESGLNAAPEGVVNIGAVAGDYDNDGDPDLFVIRYGANAAGALMRNEGAGKFTDQTASAQLAAYPHLAVSAAFVDVEHDGDLDIFLAGYADLTKPTIGDPKRATVQPEELAPAPNLLLRNNGDGKFTDITTEAKVAGGKTRGVSIVPTDYDNRRDVDLLVVNYGAAPTLFRNLRDRTFRDVASEVGLDASGRYTCTAAGDLNKDGFTDFFFGRAGEPNLFALSDGRGRFVTRAASEGATGDKSAPGSSLVATDAAQIFDYDADGLLDTIAVSDKGLRVWRNTGGDFVEVSESVLPKDATPPADGGWWARSFAAGDIDSDGDTDMIFRLASGTLKVGRNDGGNRNRSARLRLTGRVSNRSGVAAKVEARAGSLWQKFETYAANPAPAPADIVVGLGTREKLDAVRVIWASGIVQAETDFGEDAAKPATQSVAARTFSILELDRKPSSCPFLFTWNGERFEFITDMMGGGEMGAWTGPNAYNMPDPEEYVRIPEGKMKERDGRYELRITNELEEVLFVDRARLVAVAHPREASVYPNEGLGNPTSDRHLLYAARDLRASASARDDEGRDLLPRLAKVDRVYADTYKRTAIRGYAEPHTLTLDLGEDARDDDALLLLTAWTDYAFSSDNLAAAQAGLSLQMPSLQVRDPQNRWRTVIDNIGLPVGRPQTVAVDLRGKFLSASREIRIVTNSRINWDQALVARFDTSVAAQLNSVALDATRADLTARGFSAEVMPDGREPLVYDYDQVSHASTWKLFPGRYTREGDVRELLAVADDMFVISRPGDEIKLEFDARALPALPEGWTRTFLFHIDGFSKEMDPNSASPDQVAPLPFHKMTGYPYTSAEKYPDTPKHRDYMERYNTRVVTRPLGKLN